MITKRIPSESLWKVRLVVEPQIVRKKKPFHFFRNTRGTFKVLEGISFRCWGGGHCEWGRVAGGRVDR